MNNIAIIPARGGSKRIPRKNIKDFLGKPIISYSIEAAIASGLFNEVMVSTDDEEIAKIAIKYGANVPFYRSQQNSNDFSTTLNVLEEVVEMYSKSKKKISNICCIYPCAPFISVEILKETYKLFYEKKFYTVFPVVQYSNPIQRSFKTDNCKISINEPKYQNTRSQDLEKNYYDAGQFYWIDTINTFKQGKIYTENSGCVIIDELRSQDIDNEIDWKIAELKYKLLYKNEN